MVYRYFLPNIAFSFPLIFANIKEDETALILAGASGVGTSMIQLCHYAGASSIAISSSDSKLEQCKKIGAFATVNYK